MTRLARRPIGRLLTASVVVSALACTSVRGVEGGGSRAAAPEVCFDASAIDGFWPVGERFVYLRALAGVRTNLRFATDLTLSAGWSGVGSDTGRFRRTTASAVWGELAYGSTC